MPPLVSVVMPFYNTKLQYVQEAVNSILNQTYQNIEFIILDDGSTNQVGTWIETLQDPRIIFIQCKTNLGETKRRNDGIRIAKGKYIAIMDGDDIALEHRFEKQVAYLEAHPDVLVLGSWFEIFQEQDRRECQTIPSIDLYRANLIFGDSPTICHPSAMICSSVFFEYRIQYNEERMISADYDLWVQVSKLGEMQIYPEILLKYRWHNSQISQVKANLIKQNTAAIRQSQLHALGLEWDEQMLDETDRLMLKPYSDFQVQVIKEILDANAIRQVYPEPSFSKAVKRQLQNSAVSCAKSNGFASVKSYGLTMGWLAYGQMVIRTFYGLARKMIFEDHQKL